MVRFKINWQGAYPIEPALGNRSYEATSLKKGI